MKMNEKELMRWVIANREDNATPDDDWDACYSAFAEGGELEDGYEYWKNPFTDSVVSVKVCDIKENWHTIARFEHQNIYKPCESRDMINRLTDVLGINKVSFDIEEG